MRKLLIYIFLLFFSLLSVSAHAQREQILNFDSDIIVNQNASIDVTENITVHANQDRILHGIVRRLPMRYIDSYGVHHRTNYSLQQILLDQQVSPYHIERSNNHFAIYIGQLDVLLAPGNYTYTIKYHINNAINFLKDADEIYWNITGNDWDFPIVTAQATIEFPEGVNISRYTAYTGKVGAKNQDFSATVLSPNKIKFVSTKPLNPGEGLTIAVSWPKGFIQQPTLKQQIQTELTENRGNLIALEITTVLFIYFFIVWYLYGRDPRKGTIIPLFEPPENLSPEAMRYISNMGADAKTFTAAVVSMATKGALTIDNQKGVYTLFKKSGEASLTLEEKNTFYYLFENGKSLTLVPSEALTIDKARSKLFSSLKEQFNKLYFNTNFLYLIPAVLLSLLALIASISTYSSAVFKDLITMLTFAVMTGFSIYLINMLLPLLRNVIHYPSAANMKSAFGTFFFTGVFIFFTLVGFGMIAVSDSMFSLALLLVLIALNLIFHKLMKAPTAEGRKIMDQIEGFKLFLGTAEGHRLDQLTKTESLTELFEKYLPYAIALDVENAWGEKFDALMKEAGMDTKNYQPTWYTGAVWTSMTLATFPGLLNDGLDSAFLSSVAASSSASGGGGFSGGGGGGGGGGGW